jgi:hypothetical protein
MDPLVVLQPTHVKVHVVVVAPDGPNHYDGRDHFSFNIITGLAFADFSTLKTRIFTEAVGYLARFPTESAGVDAVQLRSLIVQCPHAIRWHQRSLTPMHGAQLRGQDAFAAVQQLWAKGLSVAEREASVHFYFDAEVALKLRPPVDRYATESDSSIGNRYATESDSSFGDRRTTKSDSPAVDRYATESDSSFGGRRATTRGASFIDPNATESDSD